MQNAPLGAFCITFDLHKAIIGLGNRFWSSFWVAAWDRFYCRNILLNFSFFQAQKMLSLDVSPKTRHLLSCHTFQSTPKNIFRCQSFNALFVESVLAPIRMFVDICLCILERNLTAVTFVVDVLLRNLRWRHIELSTSNTLGFSKMSHLNRRAVYTQGYFFKEELNDDHCVLLEQSCCFYHFRSLICFMFIGSL